MKTQLNKKEEQIMQILWKLKKALIKEILEEVPEPRPPYTTLASLIKKMTNNGVIGFKAYGNTNQYHPILKKKKYKKMVFKNMMKNYFSSSPEQVLSYFIKEEKIDVDELKKWFDKIKRDNE